MYLFDCLFQIGKTFFLQNVNLSQQPTDVLLNIPFYFNDSEVAAVQQKIAQQLLKLDYLEWMASPSFLALSHATLINFIKREDVQCRHEMDLFQSIIQWWKYDTKSRETHLNEIIFNALHITQLSKTAVLSVLSSCNLQPNHSLVHFANQLPLHSIITVLPARTKTDRIDCFELRLRQYKKIWRVLIDVLGTPTQQYSILQAYDKANDVIHAAGLTFIQRRPFQSFELLDRPHMPKVQCDLLLDLDYNNEKALIMITFNKTRAATEVKVVITHLQDTENHILRDGQFCLPATPWYDDNHFFLVHARYLFAIHGAERTMYVYDLLEMQMKGKSILDISYRDFPVVAQLNNIIVLTSIRENYVFDLNKIAFAVTSTHAELQAPLAKFAPPTPIHDRFSKFSAELIGNRLVFIFLRNGEMDVYTCDFDHTYHHNKTSINWKKRVFVQPFNNLNHAKIQWVDLQRQQVDRRSQRWDSFTEL